MNYLRTSTGERISRTTFDRRIRDAKMKKMAKVIEKEGYLCCEDCKRNTCQPVDCSHDISVDKCIKMGRPELAYDVNNLTIRGRECHRKHDKTDLKF